MVCIYLLYSTGIHLPYSPARFSIATQRCGYSFFVTLLSCCRIHATFMLQNPLTCHFQKLPLQQTLCRVSIITHHLYPPSQNLCHSELATILLSPPAFIYFIHFSISTVNWDFSKLLLLPGDVGSNPGPRLIDKNPVFCTTCSSTINRDIQKSMAPTCSETNC